MKKYKAPEMEVVIFGVEDVITLSAGVPATVDAGNAEGISFSNSQKAGISFE